MVMLRISEDRTGGDLDWMLADVRTARTTSIESSIRRPHLRRRTSYEDPEISRLVWERELSPSAAEDIERFVDADLRLRRR